MTRSVRRKSDRVIPTRLDYSKFHRLPEGTLGIGGEVETFVVEKPELLFVTEDNREYTEKLDRIYVLRHRKVDEGIKRIPSILGRDILNRYLLTYNKRLETVQVTDERD